MKKKLIDTNTITANIHCSCQILLLFDQCELIRTKKNFWEKNEKTCFFVRNFLKIFVQFFRCKNGEKENKKKRKIAFTYQEFDNQF